MKTKKKVFVETDIQTGRCVFGIRNVFLGSPNRVAQAAISKLKMIVSALEATISVSEMAVSDLKTNYQQKDLYGSGKPASTYQHVDAITLGAAFRRPPLPRQ